MKRHPLERIVSLRPITRNGANKVATAKRRLSDWDGESWRVKQERQSVNFSDRAGPWALVEPMTEQDTGWLNRWVSLSDDADFQVQANAMLRRPLPSTEA